MDRSGPFRAAGASREARHPAEVEETRLTPEEWRERLRADPAGAGGELILRFRERPSDDAEIEDLFWLAACDQAGDEELARAVLARLEPPPDPSRELLGLSREQRVRARGRLRFAGVEALRERVRDPDDRERIARHPARLAEVAFARRGRAAEAAALYALEHDRRLAGELTLVAPDAGPPIPIAARRLLRRATLRYEVARSLARVVDHGDRALPVMESVLLLLDRLVAGAGQGSEVQPLAWRLSFHAREWLGLRHYEAGRHAEAEREFLRAAGAAPETDLAVAARLFAANAMIRDGRAAEARALLDALRIDVGRLEPPAADEWVAMRLRLTEQDPEVG